MASSGIGAVVPHTDGPPTEVRQSFSETWAILINPSPGRTLNEVYSTIGQSLEIRANRIADLLGLGPLAVARKITSFFGTGEKRHQQLNTLRNQIPIELIECCSKLMGYTLPCIWFSSSGTHIYCAFTPVPSRRKRSVRPSSELSLSPHSSLAYGFFCFVQSAWRGFSF
jgi:hypothetical protein